MFILGAHHAKHGVNSTFNSTQRKAMSVDTTEATPAQSITTEAKTDNLDQVMSTALEPSFGDIKLIPFSQLIAAGEEGNVRTERDESFVVSGVDGDTEITQKGDVESMAESLGLSGQLQNLIVYAVADGQYAVADGETRRLGLGLLIKRGKLDNEHPVLCKICSKEMALTLSWVANEKRRPVSLGDRLSAYQRLVEGGMSREELATMNDVPLREVDRVLQLANLHPTVMSFLKKEGMSIDVAIQFARAPTQELQLAVFEALGSGKQIFYCHQVRTQLANSRIMSDSPIGKFVTTAAYKKAGGVLEGDLFSDESDSYMDDIALATRLMNEKLQRGANKHGKGYRWVEISRYGLQSKSHRYGTIEPTLVSAPEEFMVKLTTLKNRVKALEDKKEELETALYDSDESQEEESQRLYDEAEESFDKAESELIQLVAQLEEKYTHHSDVEKAYSGVVVTFDHSGSLEVIKGIQTPDDLKAYKKAVASGEVTVAENSEDSNKSASPPSPPKGPGKFGSDMQMRRRLVARVALAQPASADIARLMLECDFCAKTLASLKFQYAGVMNISINTQCPSDETSLKDIDQGLAYAALDKLYQSLSTEFTQCDDKTERLTVYSKLSQKKRDALVSFCVARTMEASTTKDNDLPADMVKKLAPDPVGMWRPCRESYFTHMKKDELYELGKSWYGEDSAFATQHAKSKKTDLVDAVSRIFEANVGGLTKDEQKVRAEWVPEVMSF